MQLNCFFFFVSQLDIDRFTELQGDGSGIGICPYDPNDNVTVIFVGE